MSHSLTRCVVALFILACLADAGARAEQALPERFEAVVARTRGGGSLFTVEHAGRDIEFRVTDDTDLIRSGAASFDAVEDYAYVEAKGRVDRRAGAIEARSVEVFPWSRRGFAEVSDDGVKGFHKKRDGKPTIKARGRVFDIRTDDETRFRNLAEVDPDALEPGVRVEIVGAEPGPKYHRAQTVTVLDR